MFIQDVLGEIQTKTESPSLRFLFMFLGVVPGSLLLFATRGRDFSVLQQSGLAWSFLAMAMLLLNAIAIGCWMFWPTASNLPRLSALRLISKSRK